MLWYPHVAFFYLEFFCAVVGYNVQIESKINPMEVYLKFCVERLVPDGILPAQDMEDAKVTPQKDILSDLPQSPP